MSRTNQPSDGAADPPAHQRCPIVGVGASAGGVEASSQLLRRLGDHPGLAVVLILHLETHHETSLPEVFSRSTRLEVKLARAGMTIEPNRVYVAPPDTALIIERGVFQRKADLHLAIDVFFASLAIEKTDEAIGVLLSGTGADGAQGIVAIKRAGGTTFVQDATAECTSMPEVALATGCVDHVLSPTKIADRLRRLGETGALSSRLSPARLLRRVQSAAAVLLSSYMRRREPPRTLEVVQRKLSKGKRAERAVEQAEHGFREMLMNAAQAITISDSQGTIVFANHLAAETFGYTLDELRALAGESLLPQRLRAEHRAQHANFLRYPRHRDSYRDLKTWGLRKDGSEFPKVVNLGFMQGDGKPLVVSFITDLTQQHVAERQIRQYQARLKRMAFDAAVTEERERRRIAADLHDGIGQALALAQIKLTSMRDGAADTTRASMDEVIELLAKSVLDTRTLTAELSPPILYDLGIKDALSWLAEEVEKRQGIHIELTDDDAPKLLDESTAALVYRAVRELLMNVFKHSKSTNANVSLRRDHDDLEIDVVDAGVGFAVGEATSQSLASGFGLFNVREQIGRLGGTMSVVSTPGHGTRVSLRVPMRQPT